MNIFPAPDARINNKGLPAERGWMFLLILGLSLPAFAAHPAPPPHPVVSIPVAPLGYRPPSRAYMLYLFSSMSLDFMDDQHLLFTFHHFRLMSREDEQGHDDQTIQAQILDLPDGKVTATAEWRMHDRREYLFPIADGSFLVRQGSEIKRMGPDLELHPYLHFPHRLQAVQVSPDGQMMTVQSDLERHSDERHRRLVDEAMAEGQGMPDEDVDIQMVRLDKRSVLADAKSDRPLRLAVTSDGYVDHLAMEGSHWKIRFHPFDGEIRTLSTVLSVCAPTEDFIRNETMLVTLCSPQSSNRSVAAITTDGRETWRGAWDAQYIAPNFSLSSEGRNFGISWIVANHPVDALFSLSDGDVQGQIVQVLSTATGHLLLSVNVSPVVSAGHNFALSADGRRLAVLNKGNLEIYEVPEDSAK